MKFKIEKSFAKDIEKVKDKKLLQKSQELIAKIESIEDINQITDNVVIFTRFLHRKEIYRYFPMKK